MITFLTLKLADQRQGLRCTCIEQEVNEIGGRAYQLKEPNSLVRWIVRLPAVHLVRGHPQHPGKGDAMKNAGGWDGLQAQVCPVAS